MDLALENKTLLWQRHQALKSSGQPRYAIAHSAGRFSLHSQICSCAHFSMLLQMGHFACQHACSHAACMTVDSSTAFIVLTSHMQLVYAGQSRVIKLQLHSASSICSPFHKLGLVKQYHMISAYEYLLQTLLVKTFELTLDNLQVLKPRGDDKQQLDKVYAKLISSKEVLLPITYFGDGTVAYAKLANVQKFAAMKSTAGLKKSLVTAMELAQAALLQQTQQVQQP